MDLQKESQQTFKKDPALRLKSFRSLGKLQSLQSQSTISSSQTQLFQQYPSIKNRTHINMLSARQNGNSKSNWVSTIELPVISDIKMEKVLPQMQPQISLFDRDFDKKRVSFQGENSIASKVSKIDERSMRNSSILKNRSKSGRGNSTIGREIRSAIECNLKIQKRLNTSERILQKYRRIMFQFQVNKKKNKGVFRNNNKFTDSLFPPVYSSLFSLNKSTLYKASKNGFEISWKRISEIFTGKKLRVCKQQGEMSELEVSYGKFGANYFVESLKAIRNADGLLASMFSECKINDYGAYCVRIFQGCNWKYIIIDDFIPVIQTQKGQFSLCFTQIGSQKEIGYRSLGLQIWPLLLEKAYASYYGSYQALQVGNSIDFVQELAASSFHFEESFLTKSYQNQKQQIDVIVLGQNNQNLANNFYVNMSEQLKKESTLILKYRSCIPIVQKIVPLKQVIDQKKPSLHIYLKKIRVNENDVKNVDIMIRQKDQRFYHQNLLVYSYLWVRAVLLYKEYDGNYLWVDGQYKNTKSINFRVDLRKGQYYLLVIPEWKSIHRHEMAIIINGISSSIEIEGSPYEWKQEILEKGCADLAQRMGNLCQINKITCSYNYVCLNMGFIIENIHNQRIGGEIVVSREWKGDSMLVIPLSQELRIKKKIDIEIAKEGQFTCVFACYGGLHKRLLQNFRFN